MYQRNKNKNKILSAWSLHFSKGRLTKCNQLNDTACQMVIEMVAERKEAGGPGMLGMCVWLREGFTGKVVLECTLEMLGGQRGSGLSARPWAC